MRRWTEWIARSLGNGSCGASCRVGKEKTTHLAVVIRKHADNFGGTIGKGASRREDGREMVGVGLTGARGPMGGGRGRGGDQGEELAGDVEGAVVREVAGGAVELQRRPRRLRERP